MKTKRILSLSGVAEDNGTILTKDGKLVVGKVMMKNVFKLVGTKGIPLEVVLEHFKKNNLLVDWIDYVEGALKDGGKMSNIKSRIMAAIGDVYGSEYRKNFEKKFDEEFKKETELLTTN